MGKHFTLSAQPERWLDGSLTLGDKVLVASGIRKPRTLNSATLRNMCLERPAAKLAADTRATYLWDQFPGCVFSTVGTLVSLFLAGW